MQVPWAFGHTHTHTFIKNRSFLLAFGARFGELVILKEGLKCQACLQSPTTQRTRRYNKFFYGFPPSCRLDLADRGEPLHEKNERFGRIILVKRIFTFSLQLWAIKMALHCFVPERQHTSDASERKCNAIASSYACKRRRLKESHRCRHRSMVRGTIIDKLNLELLK